MKFSEAVVLNLREITPEDTCTSLVGRIDGTPKTKPIVLLIDSCGGNVEIANAIIGAVARHGNVIGIVTGICNSMAISVFAACARRVALPHATFLFHSRTWDLKLAILDLEDMERVQTRAQELLDEHLRYEQDVAAGMPGQNQDQIRQLCRSNITLDAATAHKYSLVQVIIDLDTEHLLNIEVEPPS